jgi:predicted ATP-grasp superfamily ATP-dependent carboligase
MDKPLTKIYPELHEDNNEFETMYDRKVVLKRTNKVEKNKISVIIPTTLNKVDPHLWTDYVIQEYVHTDTEYAGYFVVKNGKIVYSFAYSRYYGNRIYIKGDSQDNTVQIKTDIEEKYLKIFEKFLKPIKFTGPCCIDYKIDCGKLKLIEINPRIGGSLSYPENIQDASVFITELIRIFYN